MSCEERQNHDFAITSEPYVYKETSATYVQGASPNVHNEWERIKLLVQQLYLLEDQPVGTVLRLLAGDYNFHATEPALMQKISTWGFSTQRRWEDWRATAALQKQHVESDIGCYTPDPEPFRIFKDATPDPPRPAGTTRSRTLQRWREPEPNSMEGTSEMSGVHFGSVDAVFGAQRGGIGVITQPPLAKGRDIRRQAISLELERRQAFEKRLISLELENSKRLMMCHLEEACDSRKPSILGGPGMSPLRFSRRTSLSMLSLLQRTTLWCSYCITLVAKIPSSVSARDLERTLNIIRESCLKQLQRQRPANENGNPQRETVRTASPSWDLSSSFLAAQWKEDFWNFLGKLNTDATQPDMVMVEWFAPLIQTCSLLLSDYCALVGEIQADTFAPEVHAIGHSKMDMEDKPQLDLGGSSGRTIHKAEADPSLVLWDPRIDEKTLQTRSDSGYASSLAASKITHTSRSKDSGFGSDHHSGQRSPEGRGESAPRRRCPDAHSCSSFHKNGCFDPSACSSGMAPYPQSIRSPSPSVGQSPARSLGSRAVSEGETSSATTADSEESLEHWETYLDPKLVRIRSYLVQQLVDTYTCTESEVHEAAHGVVSSNPASSSQESSAHSSSSLSRTTQTSATSLGKHKTPPEDDEDDVQDRDRPSRRKRTRVTTESISLDGRLFACPYCKYDPNRFSERNVEEKHYRGCSSIYLSTISRLKQHLYRVHQKPEFYCRSCFQIFRNESHLDDHTRKRPSCEPCDPKFAEKMTVEQTASVKRRQAGKSNSDTWFAIFRILFPEAPLPESPYTDSVSSDAIRAFKDHFQRRAQSMLSALIREQLGSTLVLHSDQERILDSALESAIAQLVMQMGPSSRMVEQQQNATESAQLEIPRFVEVTALDEADPELQMPQEPKLSPGNRKDDDLDDSMVGGIPTQNLSFPRFESRFDPRIDPPVPAHGDQASNVNFTEVETNLWGPSGFFNGLANDDIVWEAFILPFDNPDDGLLPRPGHSYD